MEFIVLAVAVAVLVVLTGVGLVATRLRSRRRPPSPDDAPPGEPQVGDDPGGGRYTAKRPVQTIDLPEDAGGTDLIEPPVVEPEPEPEVEVERPEPVAGRLVRLRTRLARSESVFGQSLLSLLSRDAIDEDTWEEIEDTLLMADIGVAPAAELVERLRSRVRIEGVDSISRAREVLREELVAMVDPSLTRGIRIARSEGRPAVVLVVGVNGTGKTTTVGKLARVLVAQDKDVVLGAADTFRAAAADQLETWGSRVGVRTVRGPEASDPASVAYEAVKSGIESEADVVLVDTAGRLHTKTGLMDELGKIKRVVEKLVPVGEVLLVIDATTGQNGLNQARVFADIVNISGIVLTKLDGTAKGGIVIAVQRELGVPVKLVGLGEGADDLAPFEADAFVDALLGTPAPAG